MTSGVVLALSFLPGLVVADKEALLLTNTDLTSMQHALNCY